MAEPIRVLVVDDHAVVREGLRAFLELARAEAGLPDVDREEVDLRGMVEHLLEPLRVDERYPNLDIRFSGEPASVRAVPERLETAVRNVLSNAAAFAPATRKWFIARYISSLP